MVIPETRDIIRGKCCVPRLNKDDGIDGLGHDQ